MVSRSASPHDPAPGALTRRAAFGSALGLVAAPAVLRGARRRAGDKPNLLFLWTDEQRADTMAVYGNYRFRVPVMNALARRSIVFDRCYDTQPVCTPARSSVLTGLWPHQNGLVTNDLPLPAGIKTFPELLADSSYRTGYFGKWHLGDELFAQHGFAEWISIEDIYYEHFTAGRDRARRSDYHHFLLRLGYQPDDAAQNRFSRLFAVRRPLEHCKPAFLAGEASSFILRHRHEPWMLYVNFLEPHMPFYGPLNDLHSEEEAPIPRNYPGIPVEMEPRSYAAIRQKQVRGGVNASYLSLGAAATDREIFARLNRNYAGLCSQVDQALGRILWALEASGQADNTILVFTADHGEMMGAHTLIGKSVMYEEAVRVPLLVSIPYRHRSQIKIEPPVSHIGLVPTLLELMGRRPAEPLAGESLLPLVEGRPRREDHVFIEWNDPPQGPNARAVVTPDGWKMAIYDADNSLLFHRERDPLEMENLYYRQDHAALVRRLRARLESWQRETADQLRLPG